MRILPRYLFGLTTICLAMGATMHALGFPRAAVLIDTAHLPALFAAVLKGLWLSNSINVAAVALLFGCLAIKPTMTAKPLVLIFAVTLLVLAALIYATVGRFVAGYLLTVAGTAAVLGCIIQKRQHSDWTSRSSEE